MESSTSSVPIYHKLHSDILKIMIDFLNLKNLTEDSLCFYIPVLMKWSKSTLSLLK